MPNLEPYRKPTPPPLLDSDEAGGQLAYETFFQGAPPRPWAAMQLSSRVRWMRVAAALQQRRPGRRLKPRST